MFPTELEQYPQWICWRYGLTSESKPTKHPYDPRNGQLASVANPSTWTDYATAVNAASNGNFYSGIGFVLTDQDPFVFIDLDDPFKDTTPEEASEIIQRHNKIVETMNSYSEFSPSSKGLHIIGRGAVPGGRRRGKVEVYSSLRYMTMTGNTYIERPIVDCAYYAYKLWEELNDNGGGNNIDLAVVNQPEQYPDHLIYSIAASADNGAKFEALWRGEYQTWYRSQSEADLALINIIGFYSRNVEQIRRLFIMSALGKRDKAKRARNYIDPMIKKSFDNAVPLVPLDDLVKNLEKQVQQKVIVDRTQVINPFAGPLFENVPDPQYDWTVPPGLIGEIAKFIYDAAPRPVKEIALAAAIGLMGGICGRSYNVSGTGLNVYVLILANTGAGKEAAAMGIDRLMQFVRTETPAAMDFIGPAEIASGPALHKYLAKQPCFVSVLGEFGLTLQQICSPMATGSQISFRKLLLSLYHKSGDHSIQQQMIYSDKDKNTGTIKSPSFSILGETTPVTFYPTLDESIIATGLLPRFLCLQYDGQRPALNEKHNEVMPAKELTSKLANLAANCLTLAQHNKVIEVKLDAEATEFSKGFDCLCDGQINASELEVAKHLWNRAHIKTLKLASLIAVGINMYQPLVTLQCIQWAKNLVERDVLNMLKQFESGKTGKETGELNQINEVIFMIRDYLNRPYMGLEKYQVNKQMHTERVFSMSYLQKRMLQRGSFRNDRVGGTNALKRAVEALVNDGAIKEVKQMDIYQRYGTSMKCYIIADLSKF